MKSDTLGIGKFASSLIIVFVLVVLILTVTAQESQPETTRAVDNAGGGGNGLSSATAVTARTRIAGRRRNNGQRRPNRGGGRRRNGSSNATSAECEEIYLPMCKGLIPYTHTKLPNRFNHTTQLQVYQALISLWAYMDHSCSRNLRYFVCSLYLPKCARRQQVIPPCRRLCKQAKRHCNRPLGTMFNGFSWRQKFPCRGLRNRRCLRPMSEEPCTYDHPVCINNSIVDVCANLSFTSGTLPNMFQQCRSTELNTELQYYAPLQASNCHDSLNFLLCGTYIPFCVNGGTPFSFPCREKCEEVRDACEPHYRRLYRGLPWPSKLQCHRYPSTTMSSIQCVMPNEGLTFNGGK